jgi:hypothetical protein
MSLIWTLGARCSGRVDKRRLEAASAREPCAGTPTTHCAKDCESRPIRSAAVDRFTRRVQDEPVAKREHPTPFEDVNVLLARLLAAVRAILGDRLVGLYLYGSLSSGGFDPDSSDVDFLVVTDRALHKSDLYALRRMHEGLARSGLRYATQLEGSYIPAHALRKYDPDDSRHPSIGVDWDFGIISHGYQWVLEGEIVRTRGVRVAGPPPASLIDPVTRGMLRDAAFHILSDFWSKQLDGAEWLRPRNYQAFAILTMCRAMYTVEHGKVISKPEAAQWARAALEPEWAPLVDRALAWRHERDDAPLDETIAFIRHVLERTGTLAAVEKGRAER